MWRAVLNRVIHFSVQQNVRKLFSNKVLSDRVIDEVLQGAKKDTIILYTIKKRRAD
jgi:hypothetical protein